MGRRVADSKKCRRCGEVKPRADFTRVTGLPNAVHSNCKACAAAGARERNGRSPERLRLVNRRAKLKRNFGLTLEQYEAMVRAQDGRCAICGTGEPGGRGARTGSFAVDHDHGTGRIRGLLCNGCNTGLGLFKDSPSVLRSAIDYLRRGD